MAPLKRGDNACFILEPLKLKRRELYYANLSCMTGSELFTHYLSWNHILMLPDRRLFKETISQYDEKSFIIGL